MLVGTVFVYMLPGQMTSADNGRQRSFRIHVLQVMLQVSRQTVDLSRDQTLASSISLTHNCSKIMFGWN